jgi:signal peptidase II
VPFRMLPFLLKLRSGSKMPKLSRGWAVSLIIFLVLVADQSFKIWVKTHMVMHDSIRITDWFYIFFTENNGMAFGIELFDKLFLTLFRIAAVIGLFWYVSRIIHKQTTRTGYLVCISLIIAGAMGNIIDCLFYGLVFDHSFGQLATFLPTGGGYAPFFYGKVVDMLYFPLIDSHWPTWMPFVGGDPFVFFRPIFNIADSSISVGIIILLLFYRKDLSEVSTSKVLPEAPENP